MAQTSLQSLLMQQFSASGKTGALNAGTASNGAVGPGSGGKPDEFARTLENRIDAQRERAPSPAPTPGTPPREASRQAAAPTERPAEMPRPSESSVQRKAGEPPRNERSDTARATDQSSAHTARADKGKAATSTDEADARGTRPDGLPDEAEPDAIAGSEAADQAQDDATGKDTSSEAAASLGLAGLPAALAAALERLSPKMPAGEALEGAAGDSAADPTGALSVKLPQAAATSDMLPTDDASAAEPTFPGEETASRLQTQATTGTVIAGASITNTPLTTEPTLPGEETASRLLAQRERGDTSLLPDSASAVAKAVREAISEFTGQRNDSQQGWGGQSQNPLNLAAQLVARNGEANGPKFADLATAPIAGTDAAGITDGSTPAQGLPNPLLNPRGEHAARATPVMHMNTAAFEAGWAEEVGNKVGLLFQAQENRAELVLNPGKLGRIEITLTMNGEQASAQFLAATPAAREALEQAMPRLREVLQQAGIMLADSQVDTSSQQQAQQEQQARQGQRQRGEEGLPLDEPLIRAGNVWIRPGEGRVDIFA